MIPHVSMRQIGAAGAALTCLVSSGFSQQSPASDESNVFELSPFEVRSQDDQGYIASGTLAGSRLNTALVNTPASISVMTEEFISDIAATSISDAVEYGLNVGNDIGGGSSDVGATTGNGLQFNEFNFQIRGYRNVTLTRDYFPTTLAADMFNVDRVEIARGPNSLIFGVGGPGGIVNTSFKNAMPNVEFTELTLRYGSWDNRRATIDSNQSLIEGKLAARVNLLYQEAEGWKDFAADDQERGALALTFAPSETTKIRLNTELGSLVQNRVRPWSAVDQISVWQDQGSYYIPYGTPESPWTADDNNYSQTREASGGSPDNSLEPNIPPGQTFERRTAHIQQPSLYMTDGPLAGKYIWVGARNEGARYYRSSYSNGLPGYNTPSFIDDFSIFPMSGNIVGPGALNDTEYYTIHGSLDQRFGQNFNVNLTAQTTDIDRRQNSVMGFADMAYKLDVTTTLPTFTTEGEYNAEEGGPETTGQGTGALNFDQIITNPLVGTPIVAYSPSYSLVDETQNDLRLSANYHLDLDAIGDHNLLGFVQRSKSESERQRYRETNVSPNRPNTSRWFDSMNFSGRVAHVDLFSAELLERGVPDPWQNPLPSSIMYGRPEFAFEDGWIRDQFSRSETTIDSMALALQSYFLDRDLVTTLGVRRDEVSITNWSRETDSLGEAIGLQDPSDPQEETGNTYSLGFVYHIPGVDWLSVYGNRSTNFQPQGGAQLFEDEDLRSDLEIGALEGTGLDAGLKFRLFEGKVYATLGYFDVEQSNAATGYDGNVTNYIDAIWTTILNEGPNTVVTDQDAPNGHRVGGRETRDQSSSGWELEVTANPTDSWRVTFNASRSDNETANLGNNIAAYLDKHRAEWEQWRNTPYDTGRSPGFLGDNTVGDLIDGLDRLVAFIKAGEGVPETNIRPWNANFFTAYSFNDGGFEGLSIGGGVNYRGDQILGVNPATLDNPVTEVFKGGDYYFANAMIGYQFPWNDVDVRIQLNVENALDNDDRQVLASSFNPLTGELEPFHYYLDPRNYTLTASFTF